MSDDQQASLERRYVGTVLRKPADALAHPVQDGDITDAALCAIVEAIRSLRAAGRRVTPAAIEGIVARDYPLTARRAHALLTEQLPVEPECEPIAVMLRERGALRRVRQALLPALDHGAAWSDVQNALQAAASVRADTWGGAPLLDPYDAVMRHLERAAQGLDAPIAIDQSIASSVRLKPGTCLVLGAPTNVGKTSLLASWLRHAACSGHGAALISCEDTEEAIGIKWVAEDAEVGAEELRDARLYGGEAERVVAARERYRDRLLRVVRVADRKLDGVLAGLRQAAALGCKVVGIDYLTAVHYQQPGLTRRDCIDHVLSEMLGTAYSLGLAVVLVSQYSREDKERGSRRMPRLSDLKESGTIENAATYVVLLWRWEDRDGADVQGVLAKVKDGRGVGTRLAWKRDARGIIRATHPTEQAKGRQTPSWADDEAAE